MGFTLIKDGQTVIKNTSVKKEKNEHNEEFNNNLDFLNSSDEEERLKTKGVSLLERQGLKSKEKINLVSFVNLLKHLSPVFQKVSNIEDEDYKATLIYDHVLNANKFALKICEKLNISAINPQNTWFINSLERIYSENFLNEQISQDEDFEKISTKIVQLFKEIEYTDPVFEQVGNDLKLELAFMNIISEMNNIYNTFDFYLEENYFYSEYLQFLIQEGKEYFTLKVKSNSLLSQEEKTIYFISLLKEINKAFIEIWKKEANDFVKEFKIKTDDEKQIWHNENPLGYDLNILFNKTRTYMQQLFNIINIVLPNRHKF